MNLRILPLMMLIAAACGPSARGPLIQPPTLRPGHGLPTYNPTQPQGKPERSPHKKLLPSTSEPGLWAGDGPTMSSDPAVAKPLTIADMPLEVAPEAIVSPVAFPLVRECTDGLGKAVWASHEAGTVRRFGESTQRCLAAFLFRGCVVDNIATKHRWRELKAKQHAGLLKSFDDSSRDNVKRLCGFREEKAASEVWGWILEHWRQEVRGW
jgi:hypothetical protein